MGATTPLLEVEDLTVRIATPRGIVHAVNGVRLTLDRGETLGLVGESGSGKSMSVRAVIGILPSRATVSGKVVFDGTDLNAVSAAEARQVWGRRIGMVFQDPMTSLNPVVRVGRQVSESARAHLGLSRRAADELATDLLGQVGIPEPERRRRWYPHQFSGGMRQRVTIAAALACEPDLLIADEATSALDVTVQKQILRLLRRIQRDRNMAMILVSHDLGVVAGWTDRIAVMYAGRVVEHAPTGRLFAEGRHRYTDALLGAIPRLGEPPHTRLRSIPGIPPRLVTPPGGCPFSPRCAAAEDRCGDQEPPLTREAGGAHTYRCFNPAAPGGSATVPDTAADVLDTDVLDTSGGSV